MINKMLLQSGRDIPFTKAGLTIHQPRLFEIAMIGGQEVFFAGCGILNFQKESLPTEDKNNLAKQTNFDILMSILKDNRKEVQYSQICALMVLQLLFSDYTISFDKYNIIFSKVEGEEEIKRYMNAANFEDFQTILRELFTLEDTKEEYNPAGKLSEKIADKFKQRKQKLAELKKDADDDNDVFSRYISILSVGLGKSYEELYDYTVYQIFEEFQRYMAKSNYDAYFHAKVAGASGMDEVDNWMSSLSTLNKNK